jgi:hypothetical protein
MTNEVIYNCGNFIVKVLPCYGVLSVSMVPWWSVMIFWVTARANPMDSKYLAKPESSQYFKQIIDMIWIAQGDYCGEGQNPFGPLILFLDGEVAWSILHHFNLVPKLQLGNAILPKAPASEWRKLEISSFPAGRPPNFFSGSQTPAWEPPFSAKLCFASRLNLK